MDKREIINVEDLNVINFLIASRDNKPELIREDLDDSDLYMLIIDFNELIGKKKGNIELRLDKFNLLKTYFNSCLFLLSNNKEQDVYDGLLELKFKPKEKNIKYLESYLNQLIDKNNFNINNTKFYIPKKPKSKEVVNIYENFSNLCLSLEMSLNFKDMTVGEYVGYIKSLHKKQSALSRQQLKNKNHGRRTS